MQLRLFLNSKAYGDNMSRPTEDEKFNVVLAVESLLTADCLAKHIEYRVRKHWFVVEIVDRRLTV